MIPIKVDIDKSYHFKYTIIESHPTGVNLDKPEFDLSQYIVIPYVNRKVNKMLLLFAKTSTATYLNNNLNEKGVIPFPVGRVDLDTEADKDPFIVHTNMHIFNDFYELYVWMLEMLQVFETIRIYEYSHNHNQHLINPIYFHSTKFTYNTGGLHTFKKYDIPYYFDNQPCWEIHKEIDSQGNELSNTNVLSDRYDDLPIIKLSEEHFNGKSNSEFYCCPYLHEESNDWIFAWYPKTYCVHNGHIKIWKKLIMDCKEYILQRGQGFLPKHVDTIKSVQHFESRFEYLLNRIDAKSIMDLKMVMVSHDGGIMGKISGINLMKIVVNHYDPKEDPWSRGYIGDDAPCPPIKENDSENKKTIKRSPPAMLGKVWFGDDE